jgi:phospholipase C
VYVRVAREWPFPAVRVRACTTRPGAHARAGGEDGAVPDRRAFLVSAARAAGAVAAASALGAGVTGCSGSWPGAGRGPTTGPKRKLPDEPLLDLPAAAAPIDHVVVVMLENRSFDHWLGWLANDQAWLEAGRTRHGAGFTVAGQQQQTFTGPTGPVGTRHLPEMVGEANPYRGCGHDDPGHSWIEGRAQRDRGFLAPGSGNDEFALGYYEAADLPFTSALATRFTVCDHSHASVLGPTFPNRMYLHSAQCGRVMDNRLPPPTGYDWETIWDRLAAANVPAGYYSTDLPVTFLWGLRLARFSHPVADFFADCAAGRLPAVSFVDPGFLGGSRTDNHPHGDIRAGERFARDVFAAFAASPHWQRGLFVLTYDEWGGFFDHVRPPTFVDEGASTDDLANFGQGGFRVPTVVASPYARRGFVDHTVVDHTSILRFLEWRFLGAPPLGSGAGGSAGANWAMTERDRNAPNLGVSLVQRPDPEVGFDLHVPVADPSAACPGVPEGLAWRDRNSPPAVEPVADHPFADLVTSGYLERLGVEVTPSPMAAQWVGAV